MTAAEPGFYAAHRPYAVVSSLADLAGPETGRVRLPIRLDWAPGDRVYDLHDPDDRLWMYSRVIREAGNQADLIDFLHPRLLRQAWPTLVLPARVRNAWEKRFPELTELRQSTRRSR